MAPVGSRVSALCGAGQDLGHYAKSRFTATMNAWLLSM
jgi:hypothetical protein